MLQRVEIKAFKSLQDVGIDLGLINVFVGSNGSGKSNLLEAIGVLGAAASGRVDDEGLLRRGVRPGLPALYKASFRGDRVRDAIRFGAFSEGVSYEVELNNPIDSPKPAWGFKTERLVVHGEKVVGRSRAGHDYQTLDQDAGLAALKAVELSAGSPGSRLLRTLREFAIYSPNTATLRGLVADPQSREPVGLSGGRLAEAVHELRQLSDKNERFEEIVDDLLELTGWVKEVGVGWPQDVPLAASVPRPSRVLRFVDRYMADGRNVLSAYDASEGALYVLFAAVIATHPQAPSVLAVDNIDSALNPRLARELMTRICRWVIEGGQRQLLVTCHNPVLLDGLPLSDDRIRLFTVDRSNHGRTVVKRVEVDEPLLARANEGWPLSRLWVSGHLGGALPAG